MINYNTGDIVLLEVIFTDISDVKKRPALIISSEAYNNSRQEVIIAAITSNTDRKLVGDYQIENWVKAGLLYPSLVTAIIQTMKKSLVIRKLGSLEPYELERIKQNFQNILF